MSYSRAQSNFSGFVDSRDGTYDRGNSAAQNEVRVRKQPVNIPVIAAASGSQYSSATYPGFRGSSGSTAVERDGIGRYTVNDVPTQQLSYSAAEPKSYRSTVSTQVISSGQVPSYGANNSTMPGVTASYGGTVANVHTRVRSDSGLVSPEPTPVSSHLVYGSRVQPAGLSSVAGKVAVASSRRAIYQPSAALDASPVSPPVQSRQIPVVVVPSQSNRRESNIEGQSSQGLHDARSYQNRQRVTAQAVPSETGGTASRTRSVNPEHSKEAEVDALTDLLVQNMNVAGNPDFCGMCVKCGRSVMGEKSRCLALDQLFHVDCFRCQACNNCLSGQPFYAMEGQPYCELCYMQTLEKCSVCSKPIVDRMLRATGKPYHPRCFTCVVCAKNLDGVVFTVDATNQIHCIDDFHRKFAPRCSVCSLPIMPSDDGADTEAIRIVVLDRNFHVECFRCEDCGVVLSSDSDGRGCYPLDEHVLCKMCNARRIQALTGKATTDL